MSAPRTPDRPLVSAVIPTRNRPALVVRAVVSALRQTYPAMEVVVVLDGPDPATLESLRTVQDARLKVIALAEAAGGAGARNRAIEAATGEWIALLDDDDEWRPNKIALQVQAAMATEDPYVMVFSRSTVRLPHVEYIWPYRLPSKGEPMSEYLFCRKGLAFGEGFLQASSFFASRRMFLEVPFREGQQRFVDTDWVLRASAHSGAEVVVLPEPLAVYYLSFEYRNQLPPASQTTSWSYLHDWARENRELFTPRAFSFFLATECVPRAAKQAKSMRIFMQLLRECLFDGQPNGTCVAICLVFWFVPEKTRRWLRDIWQRWRHMPALAE